MKKRNILYLAIILIIGLCLTSCQKPKENDTEKKPSSNNSGTQIFSNEQINAWNKANKKDENKYVLNGGYYIHFQGKNYPVVFTEGSITCFDNLPDELFFYEMYELFTDEARTKRCAYRGRYTEYYSFFKEEVVWKGYMLDGKRPSIGTVLYIDETRERQFIYKGNKFGADDVIPLNTTLSSDFYIFCIQYNGKILPIAEKNGVLFEEVNTIRKLYYKAKESGIPFDYQIDFTTIFYPSFMYVGSNYYDYSNDFLNDETFNEKNLQDEINQTYTELVVNVFSLTNSVIFNIDYQNDNLNNENYTVLLNNNAVANFDNMINKGIYTNVLKNENNEVASYLYDGTIYKVFYGTIDEFSEFLIKQNIIDEKTHTAISHFSALLGSNIDFREFYEGYNGLFINDYNKKTIYAVWDTYKTVTLHGNDDEIMNVCKNHEYTLPILQKGGYEFIGWFANAEYSEKAISKINYNDTYTDLYAKFVRVDYYTISFETDGEQRIEDITYSYGDEVMLPVLSKAFHLFKGWCLDSDLTTEPIKTITKDFSGSYRLYPCFEPLEFSITIIDSLGAIVVKVKYGENYELPLTSTKEGFLGYFDTYGNQYTDNLGNSLNPFIDGADVQLFAKYQTEDN